MMYNYEVIIYRSKDDNAFITLFAGENEAARIESEMMAQNPDAQKFTDVDELFKEMLS